MDYLWGLPHVRSYIVRSYSMGSPYNFPPYSDEPIVTLETFITAFEEQFSKHDPYVSEFCKSFDRENVYDFMARMWVVARYDDEGALADLERSREEISEEDKGRVLFMLSDSNPILANSAKLFEFSYLISLFLQEEQYYNGTSFILDSDSSQFDEDSQVSQYVPLGFLHFGMGSITPEQEDDLKWLFLPAVRSSLEHWAEVLSSAMRSVGVEKLSYISGLLKAVGHDITDNRIKLVTLVGILELLLTHNPDFNRFNVEDSISKQFSLKASVIIYLSDKSQDINNIKKDLRNIYNLRSKIAHGDFKAVEKYLKDHAYNEEKDKDDEDSLSLLLVRIYRYIKIVLKAYIEDPNFIDFLKDN